jgi:serine protease
MFKLIRFVLVFVISISCYAFISVVSAQNINQDFPFISQIKIEKKQSKLKNHPKMVIAIVDDGVRITHQDIEKYIWQNPLENSENGMDDDGNGKINDINGWDVADNNNSITPPENTHFDFYHGTHLAGIITRISESVYAKKASEYIKIMSVKSIKDEAQTTYIKHGYQGIEYAVNSGADIILTAWSVGHISEQERRIIKLAEDKGILIVAAAGNLSTNSKQYPAAETSVFSVAALNANKSKLKQSNFGTYIDISAPGSDINSASFSADNKYEIHSGTSQAAAIITAVSAIVKLQNPSYSWEKVKACIKNSADEIDTITPRFSSKLGAGAVNLAKSIDCDSMKQQPEIKQSLTKPQGYLNLLANKDNSTAEYTKTWSINPNGRFQGIRFRKASLSGDISDAVISVHKGLSSDAPAFLRYSLAELPDSFYIPGTTATVRLSAKSALDGLIEYKVEPIDFSKLYCKDIKYLKREGLIEDGSVDEDYSYHSSCKWLITAPVGKVIRFKFTELDIESKIDKIYFFNGEGTHEKILAVLSGSKIPPEFTTWGNKVLVWFVTDGKNQGKGWKANYSFQDP